MYRLVMAAMVMTATVTPAKAADLVLYGAGSLREAMAQIATQVGPEYGLAVLNNAPPEALLVALTILSPQGQKVLVDRGFHPVALPSESTGLNPA